MAITTPYRYLQLGMGQGAYDLGSGTYKVLLATSAYAVDELSHATLGDIMDSEGATAEVAAGGGYTTGGATLPSRTWMYKADVDRCVFSGGPVLWSPATFTFRYAIVYSAGTELLVACTDYETDQVFADEDCRISWPNGIVRTRLVTS